MRRPISSPHPLVAAHRAALDESERLEDHTESLRQSGPQGRLARGVINAEDDDGGSRSGTISIFHLQSSASYASQYILKRLLLMIRPVRGCRAYFCSFAFRRETSLN